MSSSEYSKQLRHPEWQKMKTRVQIRADFKCEHPDCDYPLDENNHLNVHHTCYEKGKKPWEYPIESLQCLCERHHEEAHEASEVEDKNPRIEEQIEEAEESKSYLRYLDGWIKEAKENGFKRQLALHSHQISDLTQLAGLKKLRRVVLSYNQITDLTPLTEWKKLRFLRLGSNQITDITSLAGLKKLRHLGLDYNQITDLTPLAGLSILTELEISYNQITDLTPLAGLTGLTELDISCNQITDLTPLAGLTNLKKLRLSDPCVGNIQPDNPISDDQKAMIEKALPNCSIEELF